MSAKVGSGVCGLLICPQRGRVFFPPSLNESIKKIFVDTYLEIIEAGAPGYQGVPGTVNILNREMIV